MESQTVGAALPWWANLVVPGIVALVTAYAITLRQATAQRHVDARRSIAAHVAPLLGRVRAEIVSKEPDAHVPYRVPTWSQVGGLGLLQQVARTSDDLGPARRWIVRGLCASLFGRAVWASHFGSRWSDPGDAGGADIAAVFLAARINRRGTSVRRGRREVSLGLWQKCESGVDIRTLRALNRRLGWLHSAGGVPAGPWRL